MATRLKTVEYGIPVLATVVDNTITAMTVVTAYIPEFTGVVTIKKAIVQVNFTEAATTTTGNYTSRRIDVAVGGAGATSYTNANLYTGSGENASVFYAADATTHFTTNWASGTSKTVAISVLIDGTQATLVWGQIYATVYITYEYDDAQTIHQKTVYIPLDMPVTTVAAAKPASLMTIPALDTELPEVGKVYRNMFIVMQGNINQTASTVDSSISCQIDTYTAFTSSTLEMGAISDYWVRFVTPIQYYDSAGANQGIGMTTNATHSWFAWGSVARFNHAQAYLVVTYEFDAVLSTSVYVSTLLMTHSSSHMGGTTSDDFQRISEEFWIQEPGTITTKAIAFYSFWEQAAVLAGLNMRVGTGGFVAYTDGANIMCGGNGAMTLNTAAFSLARGKNTLTFDIYRTDTADFGQSLTGFWIVNYTAEKPVGGVGAANHTVRWNTGFAFDGATATNRKTAAFAVSIPESNYFISCYGFHLMHMTNSTGLFSGGTVLAEKTNASGQWIPAANFAGHSIVETGLHQHFGDIEDSMYRFPSDPDTSRYDPEGTRRWWWSYGAGATGHTYLDIIFTYHTITYTVAGNITGSAGGTVFLNAHDATEGYELAATSRSGNGFYSMTSYDNTKNVFVDALESGAYLGRSADGTSEITVRENGNADSLTINDVITSITVT